MAKKSKSQLPLAMRVFFSLVPLMLGCFFSWALPLYHVTLERKSPTRVDVIARQYLSGVVPLSPLAIEDVTSVRYEVYQPEQDDNDDAEPMDQFYLIFKNRAGKNVEVESGRTGEKLKRSIDVFIDDPGSETMQFWSGVWVSTTVGLSLSFFSIFWLALQFVLGMSRKNSKATSVDEEGAVEKSAASPRRRGKLAILDDIGASVSELPPAVAEKLRGNIDLTKILDWRPDDRIHFSRPDAPAIVFLIVGGIGMAGLGAIGGLLIDVLPGSLDVPQPMLIPAAAACMIVGAAVPSALVRLQFQVRDAVINWDENQIFWREGRQRLWKRIHDLEGFVLRGVYSMEYERSSHSKNSRRVTTYGAQLEMEFGESSYIVIDTDDWRTSQDQQRLLLEPLAAELARILNVDWRWEEGEKASGWFSGFWKKLTPGIAVTFLAMTGLAAGTIIWPASIASKRKAALQTVEELGATVDRREHIGVSDLDLAANGYQIEFQGQQFDRGKMNLIAQQLRQIPTIHLKFIDCKLISEEMSPLTELENVIYLELVNFPLDSDGLKPFASMKNLAGLVLTGDEIDDKTMVPISSLKRLRFLYLKSPNISDEGLAQLHGMKNLQVVALHGTMVSQEGLDDLRKSLPVGRSIH